MFECPRCKFNYNREARNDCPKCGYKVVELSLEANINVDITMQYKGKSHKKINKRPSFEFKGGQEFSYSKGKYVNRNYRIDREKDKYTEKVSDRETGETIHECEEKLTEHFNHGSAKKPKNK